MALPGPAIELAEEIRSSIQGDNLPRAIKRLLDYSKQFSAQRDITNLALVLAGEHASIQRDIRKFGELTERRSQLSALAHKILELLDEMEGALKDPSLSVPPEPSLLQEVPQIQKLEKHFQEDEQKSNQEADRKDLTSLEQARKSFHERKKVACLPTAALIARGIRKDYRGGFTLSSIDLTLRPGEITGLIGINGSGKTTLLRVLAGELAADGGDLTYPLLCPERVDWFRIRSQIAYVQQTPSNWHGILEENLYLHAALHNLTGRANEEEVEFILHRLGLESYRKARWPEISGGFQMRFELAKALVGQPRLLILDEPLAPLDINTQQVFLQDLRDIASSFSKPLPIILSSQHIYEVEAIADSILFLDKGEAVFSGSLENLYRERKENIYEVISPAKKHRLLEQLEPLGVIDIEHTGLTYLISVPPDVTGRKALELLLDGDIEIRYFRDISGSSRKLFTNRQE